MRRLKRVMVIPFKSPVEPTDESWLLTEIDSRPVHCVVAQPDSWLAAEGYKLAFVVCGATCVREIKRAIRNDKRRRPDDKTASDPRAVRKRLERQQRDAERMLRTCCAWCLEAIEDDAPVIGVLAKLGGKGARPHGKEKMISVSIAGRWVPGFVAKPGSRAALQRADVGFQTCSQACAGELRAAIEREKVGSTIH